MPNCNGDYRSRSRTSFFAFDGVRTFDSQMLYLGLFMGYFRLESYSLLIYACIIKCVTADAYMRVLHWNNTLLKMTDTPKELMQQSICVINVVCMCFVCNQVRKYYNTHCMERKEINIIKYKKECENKINSSLIVWVVIDIFFFHFRSTLEMAFYTLLQVFTFGCLVSVALGQSCVRTRKLSLSGDVVIGGLFDIHRPGSKSNGCSDKINEDAIQRLEAMLFARKKLNQDNLVPGVKFGEELN